MLKRVCFILLYLLAWVVFFEIARVFFLLYEWPYTRHTNTSLVWLTFWYGLKMDFSVAAYLTVPVCLMVIAGLFIPFFRKKTIYSIYTGIILFLLLILIMIDVEIYKAWGNRVDFTPIKYFSAPKEMWASVSHLPVFWILLGILLVYVSLFWIFRKGLRSANRLLQIQKLRGIQLFILLLVTGAMIIPIRGGFQLAPLNQSSVYFSGNQFANNAAVNACWNFMHSITRMRQLNSNPYQYMKEEEARDLVKPLFTSSASGIQVVNFPDSSQPNILFILWESFTEKALHVNIDGKPVIPYFPQLIKEGIYFSNCYSSGDRTDKGISAILSGYPSLPRGSIVNYPEKTARLTGLPLLFSERGYNTFFYYGGEPEFANIKSYLLSQHVKNFITKQDFSQADMNSKWGAHDDIVMNRLLRDIPAMQQPFFTTWLTLSSHEPFETPVPVVFKGKDVKTRFLNSLHYTDSCLYVFINALKNSPVWKNTLVIISADHGHYEPMTGKRADNYRIPVLWLGGALAVQDTIIQRTVSQLDIAASLARQFRMDTRLFPFSKDLFDPTTKAWSFFTYDDGIGFITDSTRFLYDNSGKRMIAEEGPIDKSHATVAKALLQWVYTDFLRR
jgi:phosphoglycerol transferase MdoB-like AlkP superfamily enzyme